MPAEAGQLAVDPPDVPDDPLPRSSARGIVAALLGLMAIGWVVLVGFGTAGGGRIGDVVVTAAIASAPLAVLALAWLLLDRIAGRGAGARARREAEALEATVRGLVRHLADERAELVDQIDLLGATAADASRAIAGTALLLGEETALIGLRAEQLDAAAAAARVDLGVMLVDLPQAESRIARVAERLRETARLAEDNAVRLEREVDRLAEGARTADAVTAQAAERLASDYAQLHQASADAGRGIELVAATMTRTANDALDRAARSVEAMRQIIEAEGEALGGTINRARATLAQAGDERLQAVDAALAAIGSRLEGLAARLAAEAEAGTALAGLFDQSLSAIDRRFETLGDRGAECTADLAEAIAALGEHADGLARRLGDTAAQATDALDRRSDALGAVRAKVEQDVAEAERAVTVADGQQLGRQVGRLIEALKSTAIDVARMLGEDIADPAWAAYLRGDRGGFTRSAVRLLAAGEARDVLARYGAEPAFRDAVNRYVHDFEAMLRRVLAGGGEDSLGVTLLSSDLGKLYVALAQAIERLRA